MISRRVLLVTLTTITFSACSATGGARSDVTQMANTTTTPVAITASAVGSTTTEAVIVPATTTTTAERVTTTTVDGCRTASTDWITTMGLLLDRVDTGRPVTTDMVKTVFANVGTKLASNCTRPGIDSAMSAVVLYLGEQEPTRAQVTAVHRCLLAGFLRGGKAVEPDVTSQGGVHIPSGVRTSHNSF